MALLREKNDLQEVAIVRIFAKFPYLDTAMTQNVWIRTVMFGKS